MKHRFALLLAAALLASPAALAQRPAPAGIAGPGVDYVNGGVTSDNTGVTRNPLMTRWSGR